MRTKAILATLMLLALVPAAGAQTKVSGTVQCAKPTESHMLEVGDRPNHAFSITQIKCTWTKPLEIGGTQTKDDVVTSFGEIKGNSSQTHGYVAQTLANGDKATVRTRGADKLKEGAPQGGGGEWTYVSGTGKLKGIKGKGTYKCEAAGENTNCDIEGEVELPK